MEDQNIAKLKAVKIQLKNERLLGVIRDEHPCGKGNFRFVQLFRKTTQEVFPVSLVTVGCLNNYCGSVAFSVDAS